MIAVSAVEGLVFFSLFFGGSPLAVCVECINRGCTDRPNLVDLHQRQRTRVNKLTKKYFIFLLSPVCTRSHCDSSRVLKNVAIPCAPVLLCSACWGSPSLHALKINQIKYFSYIFSIRVECSVLDPDSEVVTTRTEATFTLCPHSFFLFFSYRV